MQSLNVGFDDIFANIPIDEIDDARKGVGKYAMKRDKIVFNNILRYEFNKILDRVHAEQFGKLANGFNWNMNENQEIVGFNCVASSNIDDISLLMEYVLYSLHGQGEENIEINAV